MHFIFQINIVHIPIIIIQRITYEFDMHYVLVTHNACIINMIIYIDT